jgi:hypothetical protein
MAGVAKKPDSEIPVACRKCDFRGRAKCRRYDRKFSTIARSYLDAGACYGRHEAGELRVIPARY